MAQNLLNILFEFQIGSPVFKVRRYRPKGQKKLIKKATFQCKYCNKETLKREILPTLDTLTKKNHECTTSQDVEKPLSKKKKKKRDHNAGLNIPPPSKNSSNFLNSNAKLKSLLLENESVSSESRLEKMFK